MPTTQRTSRTARLTETLAARFRANPSSPGLPLIIENSLPSGRGTHLIVIWDEWEEMDSTTRERVILEAFEKSHPGRRGTVTMARGLTASQALQTGYLPFKIEPTIRRSDNISTTKVRRAMKGVGGVAINVGSGIELRFATREQTQEAYRSLLRHLRGPFWAIVQEPESV